MSKREHQFVSTETAEILAKLTAAYEAVMDVTVRPASPESLFIHWTANLIMQERVIINYTGNQNIPSGAEGENLDALGELFYLKTRPTAASATCTERFYISEPQATAVLIPAGTRVTDRKSVARVGDNSRCVCADWRGERGCARALQNGGYTGQWLRSRAN